LLIRLVAVRHSLQEGEDVAFVLRRHRRRVAELPTDRRIGNVDPGGDVRLTLGRPAWRS
jgi:hypothetical protein